MVRVRVWALVRVRVRTRFDSRVRRKGRARLESIAAQLSDVEPKFTEVSVIARPIVSTLFRGWAARSWTHAALRLALMRYALRRRRSISAAAGSLPSVASVRSKSPRRGNVGRGNQTELGDAINVRFVVTVIVVARKQISVGGGDILRTCSRHGCDDDGWKRDRSARCRAPPDALPLRRRRLTHARGPNTHARNAAHHANVAEDAHDAADDLCGDAGKAAVFFRQHHAHRDGETRDERSTDDLFPR